MKKHFYYAMAFLAFLTVSCVSEKIETPEDRASYNPETVWEYNGDIAVLNKVIQELKSSPNREKLERRLLKNDVLWENAELILIDNKKRILVPFLSINKDNVIGVLSLVKDAEGKTTFDMVVRKDLMNKSVTLPFWKRNLWAGYFMALDKDILGIKNGSPGLMKKPVADKVKSSNTKTMQTVCDNVPVRRICITYSECESYDGGETWVNCIDLFTDCYYEYDWLCWEEPDECPSGYERDANGNCVPIEQPCPSGYERDANGNCVLINQCANAENEFDSSSGQSMDKVVSVDITSQNTNSRINGYSRTVKYKTEIYNGYGMSIYRKDVGIHIKLANNWEWSSIKIDTIYKEIDTYLYDLSFTVQDQSAIIQDPNTAKIEVNYTVKAVLECGGYKVRDFEKAYTNISVKSPYVYGD